MVLSNARKIAAVAALATFGAPHCQVADAQVGSWGSLYTMRDDTPFWDANKPEGGYYATVTDQVLLKNGKVMMSGFGRTAEMACGSVESARRLPMTFVVDPANLTSNFPEAQTLNVSPRLVGPPWWHDTDSLVASGHVGLPGGDKLYFGGSSAKNPDPFPQNSDGQAELRLYDGENDDFVRDLLINPHGAGTGNSVLGKSFGNTMTVLPDGRIWVTAGFESERGRSKASTAIFSPEKFRAGAVSPWQVAWQDHSEETGDFRAPGTYDIQHVMVLPVPFQVGTMEMHLAYMGYRGEIGMINTNQYSYFDARGFQNVNRKRPGSTSCGYDSSSVMMADDRILVAGGCRPFLDTYDYQNDEWSTYPLQHYRHNPSTVLLPDGNVLIINGVNPGFTTPSPNVFNPFTGSITGWKFETKDGTELHNNQSPVRGKQSSAILLQDGRILVAGGQHFHTGVACEQPNLRVFTPPYLEDAESAPQVESVAGESMELDSPSSIVVTLKAGASTSALRASPTAPETRSGAVLMAHGAQGRGFDQQQRYVALEYDVISDSQIRIKAPTKPRGVPGDYTLFLVNQDGKVSPGGVITLTPSTGEWYRTIVFINKETEVGQEVFIRGGHDYTVADKYDGDDSIVIVHANTQGDKFVNRDDTSLDWQTNSPLSWTAAPGTSAHHQDLSIFYARGGFGIDPDNTQGQHEWKFEVYMKKRTTPSSNPEYDDFFEFKVFQRNADGSEEWENDILHVSEQGPVPPVQTINHWAKIGHVNKAVFGENSMIIQDLKEAGLKEAELPYTVSSAARDSPQRVGSIDYGVAGAAAGGAAFLAVGAALFAMRSKTQTPSNGPSSGTDMFASFRVGEESLQDAKL